MAKITVNVETKKVMKTVEVEESVKSFNLLLSEEEAVFLRRVLGHISGNGANTRNILFSLWGALASEVSYRELDGSPFIGADYPQLKPNLDLVNTHVGTK